MPSLVSHLTNAEQRQLFDDLNYLNIGEFRSFCDDHGIPYRICVETRGGKRKRTKDTDRKAIVLDRIRHYLKTGRISDETCFSARIVRLDGPPDEIQPSDRLYHGWYSKKHVGFLRVLTALTDGEFRDGAIARILVREFWTAGKAPTFTQFAKAWKKANAQGLGYHPEAAWLTDRARKQTGTDWKAKRTRIAKRALRALRAIPAP